MRRIKLSKKLIALALTGVLLAFGLVGCGDSASGNAGGNVTPENDNTAPSEETKDADTTVEDTGSGDLKPFRVGCSDAKNNLLGDLASVAQAKGYLEEELNKVGFTLVVSGFQGAGPEINAALLSKSIDAGCYAEFPAITSKASGANTTIVAVANPQSLYGLLAVSDDIQTVKDLEGKKIVVLQGSTLQYVWEKIVKETGIDDSSIEIINSNVLDGVALLQTGDADAIISPRYSLKFYEMQGIGHTLSDVPDTAYSTILFNFDNTFLSENPDVAVAVNKALLRAAADAKNSPDEVFQVLGQSYGEVGASIFSENYTVGGTLDYLDPAIDSEFTDTIHEIYDWLSAHQLLAADVDINSYIDTQYYEQALSELGQ